MCQQWKIAGLRRRRMPGSCMGGIAGEEQNGQHWKQRYKGLRSYRYTSGDGKNKNVSQICGQMASSVISSYYREKFSGENWLAPPAATESNDFLRKINEDSASYTDWKFRVVENFWGAGFMQGWKLQTLRLFLHIYIVLSYCMWGASVWRKNSLYY